MAEQITAEQQIRLDALNIASREATVRAYPNTPTVEVAKLMADFIEKG